MSLRSHGGGIFNVLSNWFGDVALLVLTTWIINFGRSFIYYLQFLSSSIEIELISFLSIFVAARTESAQIPFSFWLRAATAALVPVSAFVTSTTSVSAGVYLLIHFSLSFTYWLNVVLLLVSGSTIFVAGLGENFEFDLFDLSTLRQLGLMIITIHIGLLGLAGFHP